MKERNLEEDYNKMNEKNEIKELCIYGLKIDGGHHKQWFLEEILKKLGYDLKNLSKEICKIEAEEEGENFKEYWEKYNNNNLFWERGIPP